MSQRQAHTRAAHFCEKYFEKYSKELEGWDDFWKFYLESNYKPHQERLIGIKFAQTFSDFPKDSFIYKMILVARWDQYYKNSIKYTGITPEMRAKLEKENRIKEEEKLENQKNKRLKKVVKKVLRIES
ncbi:hypothetical protein [Flammeovirga sp. OC4]|uniref:hypothetical protein n=1 Tax=Flammeovirga sp. OC4 TaxID=1382345 RepID=UPI0005C53606|nr:hypothetical protein [Flammeovirga sp. OC4]